MAPGPRDITELTAEERQALVTAQNQPAYRAGQLESWLFVHAAADFDEMTNLPAALRRELAEAYYIPRPAIIDVARDADGTAKYLFESRDGARFEAVYLPAEEHDAACISSQIGCPFDCRFCATGGLPFRRNLTAYEMLAQFAVMQKENPAGRIRNVVFMGQGEPMLNAEAVAAAVGLLKSHFDVGGRRITVSTVGIPEGIRKWAAAGPATKLAVSLNSAVQETRDELMPAATRYPLADLADACRAYQRATRRRLTFEYVLVRGVNDDRAHARALVSFTRGLPSKINVIPLNRWPGVPLEPPAEKTIEAFLAEVARGPMALTVRKPRGASLYAACGTLANRVLSKTG